MSSNSATSPPESTATEAIEDEQLASQQSKQEDNNTEDSTKLTEQISNDPTNTTVATVSESDYSTCDRDSSSRSTCSISTTSVEEQGQDDLEEPIEDNGDEDDVAVVRSTIAKGLSELSNQERISIGEEVHGIKTMGLSLEEESKPHVRALFLKQFQDVLDNVLSASKDGERINSTSPLPPFPIAAYQLCLRKNYVYATNESGVLRLMCLRAELWDPAKACERFLKHLRALYKYYGEDGLKQPLDFERLDYEERNRSFSSKNNQSEKGRRNSADSRGIYKKGKGGSKRKGSLDSLPDMLALKSGSIQVLPSRDRSGRRVVVLQPSPSVATSQQTQLQVQHSKFKAIFYFLCALLRRDADAQRKGFVLILNSTKTDETHDEKEYKTELLEQYREICESIPLRFSSLHCAFDKDSKKSVSHKICMNILQSYIENNRKTNIARIQLYEEDVSNDSTKNKIAPFGIPTHQIPVTHTGTIKLKEHNGWVKIQEWYDRRCKLDPSILHSKFNVIECPGTNDVLFSQGGKYWNGVNRFQRGNLEFMEFLESKIDVYQSTLSWKKKHAILAEVVSEFAQAPQSTGSPPRFLETATQIEGVTAPDGCWVELPLASPLLMQKIRQTLLNHIRRLESSGKRKPAPSKATRVKNNKGAKRKQQQRQQQEKKKQNSKDTTKNHGPNKKRKLVQDASPPSVMKNNKLAIATFGNSITSTFHSSNNAEETLVHKQSICEFLANAERIAVSTAAVDVACDNYNSSHESDRDHNENNLHHAIGNDEKLVQAIIANDDRLNKEVGELFEMDSFLRDEDSDDGERDEIADCLMGCML
jgi:hypothetical protein